MKFELGGGRQNENYFKRQTCHQPKISCKGPLPCHAMPFGREMRSSRRVVGELTAKPNVTPSPPLP